MHQSPGLHSVSSLQPFIHCCFHVGYIINKHLEVEPKKGFLKRVPLHASVEVISMTFTFTGHVHTEVDAVDGIHIDGAGLHEHGSVPLGAFASS